MHELKANLYELFDPLLNAFASLGELGLFILAFIESSFFPIPPDALYITMILKGATNPYALALIATLGSVSGALFGYAIGYWGGRPLIKKFLGSKIDPMLAKAEKFFADYGSLAMLIAAFTPIPFKVFTLTGGLCKMNLTGFTIYSFLGRAGRFFLFTYLFVTYGQAIIDNFVKITLIGGLVILAAFFVYKFFFSKNNS